MWFKVFDWQKKGIDKVSDADAGAGLKAALRLLMDEPVGVLSDDAWKVFCDFQPRVLVSREINRARKELKDAWNF